MRDGLKLALAVVGVAGFAIAIGGFPIAKYAVAEAQNDQDCNAWLWEKAEAGPHDEVENPHGCHEVCVDGPQWYKWGSARHCYYDDGGPTS